MYPFHFYSVYHRHIPSLSFLFSFYCYGHHPDLHSFPTRRSSDLPARLVGLILVAERHDLAVPAERRRVPDAEQRVLGDVQDRKSTRLNSSHVRISYAVFCLKKKKKKHSITAAHSLMLCLLMHQVS